MSSWTIRCLLLSAMHAKGVSALRGCDVAAVDFATTCPDQKRWIVRFAGARDGAVRGSPTLAHTLQSVGYTGRPEYFTMYACVYAMVRRSVLWLEAHEAELQGAQRAFLEEHSFQCAPAAAVASVLARKDKGEEVDPSGK